MSIPALTIDHVRNMLRTNKHRLDDELEIQPEMMQRIADHAVMAESRAMEAKDALARVEARIADDAKEDDPKLSLDLIAGKVRRHAERIRAWDKYVAANAEHGTWRSALESWRQKGFSLKTLADLHAAQYFSANSASSGSVARLREAEYMGDRALITEVREERRGSRKALL